MKAGAGLGRFARSNRPLPLVLLLAAAPAAARADNPWQAWEMALARECPKRHVEWVCDGCWDSLIDAFQVTLARPLAKRADALADTRRVCRDERAGFSCEMGAYLKAWRRLGLLPRFTRWGCRVANCEEGALAWRKMLVVRVKEADQPIQAIGGPIAQRACIVGSQDDPTTTHRQHRRQF